jgi:hypothetical protein
MMGYIEKNMMRMSVPPIVDQFMPTTTASYRKISGVRPADRGIRPA